MYQLVLVALAGHVGAIGAQTATYYGSSTMTTITTPTCPDMDPADCDGLPPSKCGAFVFETLNVTETCPILCNACTVAVVKDTVCNGGEDPPACRTEFSGKCDDPIVGENVRDKCKVECGTCVPIIDPEESSAPPDSEKNVGLAVGAGIGGLAVLAALIAAAAWCYKKRSNGNGEDHFANFVFYKDRTAKAAATTNPGVLATDDGKGDGNKGTAYAQDPDVVVHGNGNGTGNTERQPGEPGSWYANEEAAQSLLAEPWYFGKISRFETEDILSNKPPNSFVVRVSDKYKGYAITVFHEKDKMMGYSHIMVLAQANPDGQTLWLVHDKSFTSIANVVRFYQTNSYKGAFQLGAPARRPVLLDGDVKDAGDGGSKSKKGTGVPEVKQQRKMSRSATVSGSRPSARIGSHGVGGGRGQKVTNNVYDAGVPTTVKAQTQRPRSMSGGGRPAAKTFQTAPALPARGRSSSLSGGGGGKRSTATKTFKSAPAVPVRGRSLHGQASHTTANTYATLGATGRSRRAMTLDSGASRFNTARHSSGAAAGSGVHASNNVYDAGVPAAAKSLKSSQNGAAVGFDHDSSEDSEAEC